MLKRIYFGKHSFEVQIVIIDTNKTGFQNGCLATYKFISKR